MPMSRRLLQQPGCPPYENDEEPLIVYRPNQLPDAETLSREIASAIVRRNRLEAERNKEA